MKPDEDPTGGKMFHFLFHSCPSQVVKVQLPDGKNCLIILSLSKCSTNQKVPVSPVGS